MTASALEDNLDAIESKVEELLAGFEDRSPSLLDPGTNGQKPEKDDNCEIRPETQGH